MSVVVVDVAVVDVVVYSQHVWLSSGAHTPVEHERSSTPLRRIIPPGQS
jgi:hypothetical protein